MKKFILAMIAMTPFITNADSVRDMQIQMQTAEMSYIWIYDTDGSMRVSMIDKTDPRGICSMANIFGVTLTQVRNRDVVVECN